MDTWVEQQTFRVDTCITFETSLKCILVKGKLKQIFIIDYYIVKKILSYRRQKTQAK